LTPKVQDLKIKINGLLKQATSDLYHSKVEEIHQRNKYMEEEEALRKEIEAAE
jgi:hypothetical protein